MPLVCEKKYRVFHLIKSLGRGGAEVLLSEGLAFSNRDLFEYSYGYFLPWKNAMVSSLQDQGAKVFCFDCNHTGSMIFSIPQLTWFLKRLKVDLIHCHLPWAGVVGRLAARLARIPIVYTEHNVMERYHSWTRRANLLTWQLLDSVVAVSDEVNASIQKHAGNAVPVSVVRNGIAVNAFTSSPQERKRIRHELSIPQEAAVVGTVAVFRPQKDLHCWLRAARLIQAQVPGTHFLLVGDGILRKEIESLAESLGLSGVTHFTGLQQQVSPFLSAMDIYMNSSIFEGLPLALLEAMSASLPVVATAVGGVPEVIADAANGFLVPPRNPKALASKACLLLANPQIRAQFGTNSRRLVEQNFDIQRMVQDLEQLYLHVIQARTLDN
jgi:glycosyltransferase involved in cell wall biosynthesis